MSSSGSLAFYLRLHRKAGNAIKYTPDGGVIDLRIKRQGEDAVLSITDNGIGIRKEFLASIFEIFVQAEPATDRRASGLGLGLALVRKLTELHGGTVTATSNGQNVGSRFVVRLPALPDGTPAAAPEPLHTVTASVVLPRRILVVDDNCDAGDSIATLLRLDGHEVRVARDGSSALTCVDNFHPEVVLLDIGLPDIDGNEVARLIRANPNLPDVRLVALSGYGRPEGGLGERRDFDHYLVKPAALTQLNALIAMGAKRV
ncbi:ATP-binding protein [Cupriavidus sp. 2TAF22]|uniref:ATP-binding protein n=1 Tax=unclassified Cupriavidus TaxID=2640874 RepID=UPI003F9029FA